MIKETTTKSARVFDLDDTVLERELITRCVGLVAGRARKSSIPELTLADIAKLKIGHERVEGSIKNPIEHWKWKFHASREVYLEALRELLKTRDSGVDIYVATGRSNKTPWVDITEGSLTRGSAAPYISKIFYTPDGVSTMVSKAHVLYLLSWEYEKIEFDEDDPRTVLFLAKLFPYMTINYRRHRSTSMLVPNRLLNELPNVHVLPAFR